MGNENLTRDEAAERAKRLHVSGYHIALDIDGNGETYSSVTTARFSCSEPGYTTFIDIIASSLRSATLNGEAIDVETAFDGARLQLQDLSEDNELVVEADCRYMNTGEGLHRFVDPADNETYLYTQFEPADARRVFACFDQPDLKAQFTFEVTAPRGWEIVSCAKPAERGEAREGFDTWTFEPTAKISSYITALIAGPYKYVTDELTSSDGRTIPLGLYCRPSLMEAFDTDEIFRLTKIGFEFFENAFDQPYPFTKYDQIFVPEFNAGAMENAGCVTYRDQYIFRSKVSEAMRERRALTVLHELAHMWFGNLVTMKWWDDLWLNESFAEWASTVCMAEATQYTTSWTTFSIHEKNWAYRQDQLPSTHPVKADMVDLDAVGVNFDGITYAKGASTLKQLVHYVGRENFDAALKKYFAEHAWGNTELPDLLGKLEAASGRDLSDWTTRWLERAGVTTLTPQIEMGEDDTMSSVTITQSAPADYPTMRPHRLAVSCYNASGDTVVRFTRCELDVDGESTEVTELAGVQRPDLLLVNDDDFSYAKIRMDSASREFAIANLRCIDDSLARVLVWTSLWDQTRDGDMRARDYVELVCNNVDAESDSSIRRTILMQLQTCVGDYVARDHADAARAQACAAVWSFAQTAPAGSDAQLMYVQTLAAMAATDEFTSIIAGLLDGSTTLDGLEIDDDLTWDLVKSLSAAGRMDEDAIAGYAERDKTATGDLAAAHARAAIPTKENKAATWREIVSNDSMANDTQLAVLTGFTRVHDTELLSQYVDPYFAELGGIWERRTHEMATQVTLHAYPTYAASPELLKQTDEYLDDNPELRSAGRRTLSEQRDTAARILRVRKRDAQDS